MKLLSFICGIAVCSALVLSRQTQAAELTISLDEAMQRSLDVHPALKASAAREAIGAEEEIFAGRLLNPTLAFDWDNWGGDRTMSDGEYTLMLAQEIETGGKRAARREKAVAGQALSVAETRIIRRKLQRDVQQAYVEAWASEERVSVVNKQHELLEKDVEQAQIHFESGRLPRRELIQKQALLYEVETVLATERLNRDTTRLVLSALWLGNEQSFALQDPQLKPVGEMDFSKHSRMKKLEATRRNAAADWHAVKAEMKGNPEVAIGARYDADSEEQSFVAGIAMPLPFFGRRSAAITAARMRMDAIDYDQNCLELELRAEQRKLRAELLATETTLAGLHDKVLPALEESLLESEQSYTAGMLSFTELNLLRRQKLENVLRCVELNEQRLKLMTELEFLIH